MDCFAILFGKKTWAAFFRVIGGIYNHGVKMTTYTYIIIICTPIGSIFAAG